MVLSIAIYSIVAFAVNGVGSIAANGTGDGDTALVQVFENKGLKWMGLVISICAILGITAATFTNLMS